MYNSCMTVQITIRGVPEEVRNELAARAARAGKSMQQYLKEELVRLAERPDMAEWLEELRHHKVASGRELGPDVILSHRDAGRCR